MKQECQLLPLLFNIVLEFLASSVRQEKYISGLQVGEEEKKPPLFSDKMIICIENPMEFIFKILELVSEFSNIAEYKFNRQISNVFLYTSNEQRKPKFV